MNSKTVEENVDKFVKSYISPDFSFRKYQKEIICSIIEDIAIKNINTNRIIEAPTGSGKSLINIISACVLALYYNKTSYILCSDLSLWEQYSKFIKSHRKIDLLVGMIKGQTGNYECLINHEDMRNADCRMANISWATLFDKHKAISKGYDCAEKCEYVKARKKALNSKVVLCTYQFLLYQLNIPYPQFTNRDVIFCDECHNIPQIVQKKLTPTINNTSHVNMLKDIYDYVFMTTNDLFDSKEEVEEKYEIFEKYASKDKLVESLQNIYNKLINDNNSKSKDFQLAKDYYEILCMFGEVVERIQNDISKMKENKQPINDFERQIFKTVTSYQNYKCYWSDFMEAMSYSGEEYLIKQIEFNIDDHENPIKSIRFNCVKEDWMIYNYLLKHADYRVFTSATTGGQNAFNENCGISYTESKTSKFDVIPFTFDFSKSPIVLYLKHKFSMKDKNKSFIALNGTLNRLYEHYKDCKGMIQTGNYEFAKRVISEAPKEVRSRMLLYNGSKEKDEAIEIHKRSKNTILVGPTLFEGIDLPEDDCRFIIILKVPYPNLGDNLNKAKMEIFPKWYETTASISIIQGIGRGVRNYNDWCHTYILDGCFNFLYQNNKNLFENIFKNRQITWVNNL